MMFKKYIILIFLSFTLIFGGCVEKTKIVYLNSKHPIIKKLHKVSSLEDVFIENGCLFFGDRNTSLCGDDLKIIFIFIKKLRIQEETCLKQTESYNAWAKEENKKNKTETVYSK